jgi:pseudouridine 5'-phosphatase
MGLQKEAVSKKIIEIFDLPLTWEEYADLAQAQIEVLMKNCRLMPGTMRSFGGFTNLVFLSFLFFSSNSLNDFIDRETFSFER